MKDIESNRDYQNADNKDTQIAEKDNCDINSTNNNLGKDSTIYTIYGNNDNGNEKLSGSLTSIITTSIASSDDKISHKGENDKDISAESRLKQEKWTTILLEVSIPFILAGIGTIGAGIILGEVKDWDVFQQIPELLILVPALLGLKGNLDMCLASRLSTQANLGNMSSRKEMVSMITGNISLVQVQSIVASFLVAVFAITFGYFVKEESKHFQIDHALLIVAAAMFTATSTCFVLDFVLIGVILMSRKFKMNPDNLATPLAASIGDVVSITLFSFIVQLFYSNIDTHIWVTYIVIAIYVCMLPLWVVIVYRNKYVRDVLLNGWIPVLSALCISGMGGLVLKSAANKFDNFAVFQPIINGIGGNLVSVQASKISTMLHQSSIMGILPPHGNIFEWPWKALFKGVPYAKTARILLMMSIPGQIIFSYVANFIHTSDPSISVYFELSYLCASTIQIMILLYVAHIIIHAMWKYKIDPDNSAIPYLTALGDLSGSCLLLLAFMFLNAIGAEEKVDAI